MWDYNTRSLRRGSLVLLLAFLVNLLFLAASSAGSAPAIVRIEADWELVMGTPDPATSSPQIVCAISPTGDINGWYAVFELNQQSLPSFSPGGMQLQLWEGELPLAESNHASGYLVEEEGETITWTQAMNLEGGQLWFSIRNGKSTTWGDFGAPGTLQVSTPTNLQNLNGFNLEISLKNSGVGFGGNRVNTMILKRLRFIAVNGATWEQEVNSIVHQAN